MVKFLTILAGSLFAITYICLAIKVGFIVMDKTYGTGFSFGYYMIVVTGMIAIPVSAVAVYLS